MHPFTETLKKDISFTMCPVAGGSFMMGSDEYQNEKPKHRVELTDFYMCEHPVTQAVWECVMDSNPSYHKDPVRPVEQVSWDDAQAFIKKLNAWKDKHPNSSRPSGYYSLPTEAQWEYAARGGQKSESFIYAGSSKLEEVGYYDRNSAGVTRPVGQLYANELGLYDMSGNVWEWCLDWYSADYYKNSPAQNPHGPETGSYRVLRGGSWRYYAQYCRVAYRYLITPDSRISYYGFRLVFVP